MNGKYSLEFKAMIMAELATNSIRGVAREHDIPVSTVGNWSRELNQSGVPIVSDTKKEEIGDRLVIFIHKSLDAQSAMLETMANGDYLKEQDIAELAVAFGIVNDKLDRLVARLSNASENQTPVN